MPAEQAGKAFPLRADDQGKGAAVIDIIVGISSVRLRAVDPETRFFELPNSAHQVDYAGYRQPFSSARSHFSHRRRHFYTAILWDNDPVHPGGIGGAQQRTEVLWVLQMSADDQKRRTGDRFGLLEQLTEREIPEWRGQGNHTLMLAATGEPVKLATRHILQGESLRAGGADDLLNNCAPLLGGEIDMLQMPAAKRSEDGLAADDQPVFAGSPAPTSRFYLSFFVVDRSSSHLLGIFYLFRRAVLLS